MRNLRACLTVHLPRKRRAFEKVAERVVQFDYYCPRIPQETVAEVLRKLDVVTFGDMRLEPDPVEPPAKCRHKDCECLKYNDRSARVSEDPVRRVDVGRLHLRPQLRRARVAFPGACGYTLSGESPYDTVSDGSPFLASWIDRPRSLFGMDAMFTGKRTDAAAVGPNDKIKVTKIESFVLKNSWVFVKISTDAGIVGWGEMLKDDAKACAAGALEVGNYLIGQDPPRGASLAGDSPRGVLSRRSDQDGHLQRHRSGALGHHRQGVRRAGAQASRRSYP